MQFLRLLLRAKEEQMFVQGGIRGDESYRQMWTPGERERVVLFPRAMRGESEPNRMQGQSLHLHLREDPGYPA